MLAGHRKTAVEKALCTVSEHCLTGHTHNACRPSTSGQITSSSRPVHLSVWGRRSSRTQPPSPSRGQTKNKRTTLELKAPVAPEATPVNVCVWS
ncbi:hypothetical protein J6590_006652 [Homalodisca vitripennis]|nr:hypothetical protein J6590_006652 [Homalodisca vitripennis]